MKPLLLTALLGGSSLAQSAWSPQGRTLERESYDRSSLGVHFVLLPGEDPLSGARGCALYFESAFPQIGYVGCFAFRSSAAYNTRFGKLRLCYAALASRLDRAWRDSELEQNPPKRCPKG